MQYTHPSKLFYMLSIILVINACNSKKETVMTNKAEESQADSVNILIGVYTGDQSKGIYQTTFDQSSGKLSEPVLLVETENPSYLTQSEDGNMVYAVNENAPGMVSAFVWKTGKTGLTLLNQQSSEGDHPCYVSLNASQELLAAANYSSGNIVVYKILEDGSLDSVSQVRKHVGSGPVKPNQESAHAHCASFDTNGKYLYVADLGIDEIAAYPIDGQNQLGEKKIALAMEKGDGPRHMVFHPSKDLVFIVNELSNTVVSAKVDHNLGTFKVVSRVSTLPEDFKEFNACADIHMSADGKFIYASNRGHNSLAIIALAEDGSLKTIGQESVKGNWPRNFMISPNEKYILVANQESNNVTVFERDVLTGLLKFTSEEISIIKPVCLQVQL